MSTEIEALTETITLPADPEALAKAIVEHYQVGDLFTILRIVDDAVPKVSWADMLEEMRANPRPLPDPDAEPEGGWNDDASKGLSDLQHRIIADLWSGTQRREYHFPPKHPIDVPVQVSWKPERYYSENTPSERAVVSRALRRLWRRGLVMYYGYSRRADSVALTAEGRRHARRTETLCELRWMSGRRPETLANNGTI
jgi:hypothetical protein